MTVQLNAFLMMNGNAKEAIEFYKEALGASVQFYQTIGDTPDDPNAPVPENGKELVAHCVLKIGETNLMIADTMPGKTFQAGNHVQICISTNEVDQSKKFYEMLKQEGHVEMPLQAIHFSPAYGIVTDKFGVTFLITTFTSEEAVRRGHQKVAK